MLDKAMSWLGRLFGAVSSEEMEGIHLSRTEPYWEVDGPESFQEMFNVLRGWVPDDAILYFEDGSTDAEIDSFMATHAVPEVSHVLMGTLWPRTKVFHVPATDALLNELARIMEHHAVPELAIHFHIYRHDSVLLEWYDAFSQPMLIGGTVPEESVREFADKIGKHYRRIAGQDAVADG